MALVVPNVGYTQRVAAATDALLVFNGTPSSCFPCSTGLGSSFDVDLAAEVGKALGQECRAKSAYAAGLCVSQRD